MLTLNGRDLVVAGSRLTLVPCELLTPREILRSMQVDPRSLTPYSDATQVQYITRGRPPSCRKLKFGLKIYLFIYNETYIFCFSKRICCLSSLMRLRLIALLKCLVQISLKLLKKLN